MRLCPKLQTQDDKPILKQRNQVGGQICVCTLAVSLCGEKCLQLYLPVFCGNETDGSSTGSRTSPLEIAMRSDKRSHASF
jgi:hypothetical protein